MKKSSCRKIISVLLSILMTASLFTGLTINGFAAQDFTDWTTSDALPAESGAYVLQTDVTLSRTWSPADGTTLDLNGHKITRSGSIYHFISVENGVTFTLDDSKKNSTDSADKHYYSGSAPVSISDSGSGDFFVGGYLTGISCYADPGGAIIVQPGGNCIMKGGNIVGNRNGSNAGGVMVRGTDEGAGLPGGVFTLDGGNIIGNSAGWGGGVYTQGGSTFNLVSGSITSNYATNGGGGVLTWGTFNMSGGVVSKNSSIGPAGFYLFEGEFHLSGGTITGNSSYRDQGGVGGAAKTYLSGNPVVSGNTSRGNTSNFSVPNGKTLTLEGALTEGASIAVNMQASPSNGEPLPITSGWSEFMGNAAPDDYFVYDNASMPIILSAGGEIQLIDPSKTYYNATFAAGEGSGTMAGTTTAVAMTLPENGFTAPEGQIFYGWLAGSDGEMYQPGAAFAMTEDTVFTAQWGDAVYVTFYSEGGGQVETQALVPNTTATEPTGVAKEGMMLRGWRLNGAFFDFSTPVTDDIVLHAVWAESTTGYNPAGTVKTYSGFEALDGSSGYSTAENYPKLVDGDVQTKWCGPAPSGYIEFYCEETIVPTGYILTTANDTNSIPGRNPKNWTIQAKLNDDDPWTTIASVENDTTLQGVSFTDFDFAINGCTDWYRYFRFAFSAVKSGDTFQLSELRLKGIPAIMALDHDLNFGVAENVLTATCSNDPCAWEGNTLTLTLNAPAHIAYGDCNSPAATLNDLDRFNVELDLSISEDDIEYYNGETLLAAAPTDAGDYTASLTTVIDGSSYTITKDYTIEKADPAYEIPNGFTAVCGETLRDIALPDGWAWDDANASVGDEGVKIFAATYTPGDTVNYNTAAADLTLTVYRFIEANVPTCTEDGNNAYYTCGDGKYYTRGADDAFVEITESEAILPATDHDYRFDSFVWAADNTAQAKLVCGNNPAHVTYADAAVTSETTAPTETEDGFTVYTAVYEEHTDYRTVVDEGSAYGTGDTPDSPAAPTDGEKIHGEHCFCYNVSEDSTYGSLIHFLCGIICALITFLSAFRVA